MAVPKIELREGEELWFERFSRPNEAPNGVIWKVNSEGVVLETLPVPEGDSFEKAWCAGKLLCEISDEDFWPISLADAQKLFTK